MGKFCIQLLVQKVPGVYMRELAANLLTLTQPQTMIREITRCLKTNKIDIYLPLELFRLLKWSFADSLQTSRWMKLRKNLQVLNSPVIKVAQLTKRKTNQHMPHFQIQLTPSDKTKEINELISLILKFLWRGIALP